MKKTKMKKTKKERYTNAVNDIMVYVKKGEPIKSVSVIARKNNIDKNFGFKLIKAGILKKIKNKKNHYELLTPHYSTNEIVESYFNSSSHTHHIPHTSPTTQTRIEFNTFSEEEIKKINSKKIFKGTRKKFLDFVWDLVINYGGSLLNKGEIKRIHDDNKISKNSINALLYSKILSEEDDEYRVVSMPKDLNEIKTWADNVARCYSYITQTHKKTKKRENIDDNLDDDMLDDLNEDRKPTQKKTYSLYNYLKNNKKQVKPNIFEENISIDDEGEDYDLNNMRFLLMREISHAKIDKINLIYKILYGEEIKEKSK